MNETNFKCKNCKHEMFVPSYSTYFDKSGNKMYKTKHGQLNCSKCGSTNITYIEKEGEYNVNFGKFSSATSEQKKAILAERSKKHFDKHIKEKKDYMDKNFKGRGLV